MKNWFMLSVRISSYGCTREVWRARKKRMSELLVAIAESNSSFLSVRQASQVHPKLDIRAAKSMNQFFYNMVTTAWALKHVLFLIDYL